MQRIFRKNIKTIPINLSINSIKLEIRQFKFEEYMTYSFKFVQNNSWRENLFKKFQYIWV